MATQKMTAYVVGNTEDHFTDSTALTLNLYFGVRLSIDNGSYVELKEDHPAYKGAEEVLTAMPVL